MREPGQPLSRVAFLSLPGGRGGPPPARERRREGEGGIGTWAGTDREAGAALVLVLWITMAVAVLAAALTQTLRFETRRIANRAAAAEARAALDTGLALAVLGLGEPDPARRWIADGRRYSLTDGEIALDIRGWDETGRLDLARAPVAQVAAVLRPALGPAADRVVRRLAARAAPPVHLAELAREAALSAAEYRALARIATLHNGLPDGGVALRAAPVELLRAWPGLAPQDLQAVLAGREQSGAPLAADAVRRLGALGLRDGPPGDVVTVRVAAVAGGARASAEALLWLRPTGRAAYRVLDWREPAPLDEQDETKGEAGS